MNRQNSLGEKEKPRPRDRRSQPRQLRRASASARPQCGPGASFRNRMDGPQPLIRPPESQLRAFATIPSAPKTQNFDSQIGKKLFTETRGHGILPRKLVNTIAWDQG